MFFFFNDFFMHVCINNHLFIICVIQSTRLSLITIKEKEGEEEEMEKRLMVSDNMKLLLALLLLQLCYAGFHIVSRVALNIGVSKVVYPVYRNVIALLLLGPCAYFIEK